VTVAQSAHSSLGQLSVRPPGQPGQPHDVPVTALASRCRHAGGIGSQVGSPVPVSPQVPRLCFPANGPRLGSVQPQPPHAIPTGDTCHAPPGRDHPGGSHGPLSTGRDVRLRTRPCCLRPRGDCPKRQITSQNPLSFLLTATISALFRWPSPLHVAFLQALRIYRTKVRCRSESETPRPRRTDRRANKHSGCGFRSRPGVWVPTANPEGQPSFDQSRPPRLALSLGASPFVEPDAPTTAVLGRHTLR